MTDWGKRELGKILVLNYGWSLPEKRRVAGDYPVYGSNGIVGWHNVPLVETQGLIIGRKGSAGNVHYSRKPFCPIDTTFFITPNDTSLEIEFLYYLLLHVDLKRVLGDVGVPGLNREVAYKEKACFPPDKSEQRRIARILSTVQTAIAQQERLIALMGELKAALLRKLFTEGLRGEPQKMTEIGLVPESWEVDRLGNYCKSTAFGPRFSSNLYSADGNVVTLRTTDLDDDGNIDYRKAPKAKLELAKFGSHLLQSGDVVVSRSGTCGIAAVYEHYEMPVIPGAFLIRVRLTNRLRPQFIRYYINSPIGRPRIMTIAQGAVQKNISGTSLKNFGIPVPILEEQEEISAYTEILNRKLKIHEEKKTHTY